MKFSAFDNRGRRKYLNASEGDRFLQAAGAMQPEEELFCRLLFFTGCRLSEGLSLVSESIDSDENVLQIRTLKKRDKEQTRRIQIPQELSSALRKQRKENDRVWGFSRTTAWRCIKTVMIIAEIEGIHACPKGLRHGFGVRAALAGIPVTMIQKWMGHSKVETTAIYLDVRDAEERELMKRTWGELR